jgi:hypothetical protein
MVARSLAMAALAFAGLQVGAGVESSPLTWAKPDHFWYRIDVAGGYVWLNVDALHGVREPLFDHQRLAIELNLRSGYEFTPTTLPFADPATEFVVKYDGSNAYIQEGAMAIEFILDGSLWRCDLQIKWNWNLVPPTDYECLPRRPMQPGSRPRPAVGAPVASPDRTWEALIVNHNVAVRAAGSAAPARSLSTDGAAAMPYDPGSIRWSRDGKTVSAWRVSPDVWRSTSVTGSVKSLVARGEWIVQSVLHGQHNAP